MASGGNSSSSTDRSITAQDSEIIEGGKQTISALGDVRNQILGDGAVATDSGAFEMVGNLGAEFLKTVGGITQGVLSSAANGMQAVAQSISPQSATVADSTQTNKTIRAALIVAGAVAVIYIFKK